ncbi:hypothetical protein H6F51_02250 [Cyanobacteria bacterium FACHB-DQ100]|nr:hypothetical protein [Cyanobacteria bacterium FACHB-DQ100]
MSEPEQLSLSFEEKSSVSDLIEQVQAQQRRIRDLEQALDQSIASLEDLRSQVVNQHFLERQLASTEEIANVQQQAIHQLKLQFSQQKAELEHKIQQAQQRERDYQSLLAAAEARQQAELTDVQPFEIEQQLQVLQTDLQLRRQQLQDLESEKQESHTRRIELEAQVEALEARIARHMTTQALLQQVCQELEVDREQSQGRITELESQAAEMQEQILSQAQQASEYETAIQHWKTRFHGLHEIAIALKQALTDQDLPPEIKTVLDEIDTTPPPDLKSTTRSNSFKPESDIPEFLVRRRTYRTRKS